MHCVDPYCAMYHMQLSGTVRQVWQQAGEEEQNGGEEIETSAGNIGKHRETVKDSLEKKRRCSSSDIILQPEVLERQFDLKPQTVGQREPVNIPGTNLDFHCNLNVGARFNLSGVVSVIVMCQSHAMQLLFRCYLKVVSFCCAPDHCQIMRNKIRKI